MSAGRPLEGAKALLGGSAVLEMGRRVGAMRHAVLKVLLAPLPGEGGGGGSGLGSSAPPKQANDAPTPEEEGASQVLRQEMPRRPSSPPARPRSK